MKNEMIKLIETNKISTTEVADVLGKTGQINGLYALNKRHFVVGEVAFVYALNNSNWEVHRQLDSLDCENKIVYVHPVNCDRSIFGDLVSKYTLLYKKAKAIVVNGLMRDAHTLIKENYPIWLTGVSPIGCVNVQNKIDINPNEYRTLKAMYEGNIMVCDDSGVVMVSLDKITEEFIKKLHFIEYQEDIWFYCLDTLKMSTYDIVCLKKYLTSNILDTNQLQRLSEFSTEK
jgi:regulator of RNase E activity RraA